MQCNDCPRKCNTDRSSGPYGWCRTDEGMHIASICLHHGEEPPISGTKGIVNLFFEHCNMQCIYCQNYEISCNTLQQSFSQSLEDVCDTIESLLPLSEGNLGFVSPSHCIDQMISIVNELHKRGDHPVIVYNSNGYDSVKTLRRLEGIVDVWLPDFKYSDDTMAEHYSAAPGYSAVALSALKEMVHQCGVTLQTNDRDAATRGVIVRHLVLPGAADNSIGVLKMIAEEVSPNLNISLMSQYYPPTNSLRFQTSDFKINDLKGKSPVINQLHRPVTKSEYESVINAFHGFGFHHGWLQEYDSRNNYRPDFSKEHPFK